MGNEPGLVFAGQRTVMSVRMHLAREGWETEDRYSRIGWGGGQPGYTAWVSRWDWHGVRLGFSVAFHGAVRPDRVSVDAVEALWERLFEVAMKAYRDFPASIPYQDADGQIVEDCLKMRLLRAVYGNEPWGGKSDA